MKTFMLLSFILLTACNQSLHYDKAVSITADFKPYVDDFVSEGKIVGKTIVIDNLSIHFIPTLEGSVIGECWGRNYGTAGTPSILISKEYWDYANEVERHVLLFHEMGHCVLGVTMLRRCNPSELLVLCIRILRVGQYTLTTGHTICMSYFMGFEFIFAYLENMKWVGSIFGIIAILFLTFLIVARIDNAIDKDDWMYLIFFTSLCILVCGFLISLPSVKHIAEVKHKMLAIEVVLSQPAPPAQADTVEKPVDFDVSNVVLLINPPIPGTNQGEK